MTAEPETSASSRRVAAGEAHGLAWFAFELGVLKCMRRAGWWHAGVRDPESVAEHSLRVAQLAALIAAEDGADPARASFLALWHDTQVEVRRARAAAARTS